MHERGYSQLKSGEALEPGGEKAGLSDGTDLHYLEQLTGPQQRCRGPRGWSRWSERWSNQWRGVGALNQGDAPADALDKFVVAAAFDWVVHKKPNTNLTVCQDVKAAGRGGAGRLRGEDSLEGMVEG